MTYSEDLNAGLTMVRSIDQVVGDQPDAATVFMLTGLALWRSNGVSWRHVVDIVRELMQHDATEGTVAILAEMVAGLR